MILPTRRQLEQGLEYSDTVFFQNSNRANKMTHGHIERSSETDRRSRSVDGPPVEPLHCVRLACVCVRGCGGSGAGSRKGRESSASGFSRELEIGLLYYCYCSWNPIQIREDSEKEAVFRRSVNSRSDSMMEIASRHSRGPEQQDLPPLIY